MEIEDLISVIIPVYNVEKYLNECIESVLAQTYQNFELILVDDGSTDLSGQICDQYAEKDDRIKVIHKTNGGASSARNVGLKKAIGKYVYFLDSDDKIEQNALHVLFLKAEQEQADILFFEAYSFQTNNQELMQTNYIYKNKYINGKGATILESLIKNKEFHVSVPLLFIRRAFLADINISFVEGIIYEDMIFTYELFGKADKVVQVSMPLYQRRYRTGSVMKSPKRKKNYLSACIVYEHLKESSLQMRIKQEISNQYIARNAFNALNVYKQMPANIRSECRADYDRLKKDILKNAAYNDNALKMRCYGTFFWFCYKVYEKTLGVILKGKR